MHKSGVDPGIYKRGISMKPRIHQMLEALGETRGFQLGHGSQENVEIEILKNVISSIFRDFNYNL